MLPFRVGVFDTFHTIAWSKLPKDLLDLILHN